MYSALHIIQTHRSQFSPSPTVFLGSNILHMLYADGICEWSLVFDLLKTQLHSFI